jgi:hypothetical protein
VGNSNWRGGQSKFGDAAACIHPSIHPSIHQAVYFSFLLEKEKEEDKKAEE